MKNKLKNVLPIALYIIFCLAVNAYAEDMWEVANRIIVDVYNKIAGISIGSVNDYCMRCRNETVK